MTDIGFAFWLSPDWSGGSNMRDPGVQPFWMLEPAPLPAEQLAPTWPTPVVLNDNEQMQEARQLAARLGFTAVNWQPKALCKIRGKHLDFRVTNSFDGTPGEFEVHAKCCNLSGAVYVR